MKVYQAINKVQAELATLGITKDRRNNQGTGYNFRGIDDVYNTVAPLLSKHGLCILPRVLSRDCVERQSKNGGTLFYTTVEVEFDFVSSEDASKHVVKTFGEAMIKCNIISIKYDSTRFYSGLRRKQQLVNEDNE